jgi:hypothetical protein
VGGSWGSGGQPIPVVYNLSDRNGEGNHSKASGFEEMRRQSHLPRLAEPPSGSFMGQAFPLPADPRNSLQPVLVCILPKAALAPEKSPRGEAQLRRGGVVFHK